MAENTTIFQRLNDAFRGGGRTSVSNDYVTSTNPAQRNEVLYSTNDRAEYERKLASYRQQKYLAYQWKKAGADNSLESLAGYNAVKLMYRDVDLMDGTCEIGAALDIISEEACLSEDTKIKLLNGETFTIKELFRQNLKDFWVYSVDEKGNCKPSHVDGVIYKGEKDVIEIELDDGTKIKSTEDHEWMLSDCKWKKTSELKIGDSLMSIYDSKNYLGYEEIKSSFEDNHRVKSIKLLPEKESVYDLLNSSTNNCFGVVCNNGLIISHNCPLNTKGVMLNIHSKSSRTKSILEDLFVNRLHIYTDLPMIARHVCKYGNTFQLLNIDKDNGIMGWMMMPVYEVDREENGYGATVNSTVPQPTNDIKPDEIRFVWKGHNGDMPYFNWQVAHFRLLNDSFFLPYGCIVGDSRVETENGYKEIDSIEIGDKVWAFDIEKQEKVLSDVSMASFKGIKDVYELRTRHNFIEATDDHKFLCYENENFIYKELKNIKIGDLLIIDNSNNKHNEQIKIDKSFLTEKEYNPKKSIQWWSNYIKYIPDFVDEDFAEFFGFMIGDGWISNNGIYLATGEYDCFNKKYIDYLHKITNKKIFFTQPKHKINYSVSQAFCYSKCLKIILKRMGFNGHFNEKRVPEWVFMSNDNIKKAFLKGIMTADGSYNIDKYNILRCCIELSNEQLIKDLKILVQSIGYKTGKICCRNRIGKETILSNGCSIKTKHCSFYFYYFESQNIQEKKYDIKNRKNIGFKTEKVVNKTYVGKKKTYDITINNHNSNFFANGIVTHNCSLLHKARRAWRMWSMMEDAMLIWRLDKAIERRVYKVYVGAIDDADVPAYINDIANNFKRTQIIDPVTGQVDLRKNFLDVSSDYFIPVRREDAPNPIETLQAANSQVQMEDIEYMQNKIFAALRVPKTFLNFQEAQGKGQNLSFMDVRFSRMIIRVQQFLLMELNKIAMIHLYLMGLADEIGNFQLTLNTPSTTIEAQELEDLNKRLSALQIALTDPGTGMPMMSMHKALREIMKMNDREILDMFNEIRLEKAMAAELQATANVIKHTGMFDITDRIYGDFESINNGGAQQQQLGQGEDELGGGGGAIGGGGIGGDLGGDDMGMDLGEPGADDFGDLGGQAGETEMGGAPNADEGIPMESRNAEKPVINEYKNRKVKSFTNKYMEYLSEQNHVKPNNNRSFTDIYLNMLEEGQKAEDGDTEDPFDFELKTSTLQEKMKTLLDDLDALVDEDEIERETLIEEAIKELPDFSGTTDNN